VILVLKGRQQKSGIDFSSLQYASSLIPYHPIVGIMLFVALQGSKARDGILRTYVTHFPSRDDFGMGSGAESIALEKAG